MKKLLVLCLLCISAPLFAVEEREGFYKMVTIPQNAGVQDYPVLTVPAGKRFVLLQIDGYYGNWREMKVDGVVVLNRQVLTTTHQYSGFHHNFSDRCFVVEEGQSVVLTSYNNSEEGDQHTAFTGYFYNCNCTSLPLADLDKDCKVNFSDLALMASEWLVDNTA